MICEPKGNLLFEDLTHGFYSAPTGFTFGVDCRPNPEINNE